MSAEPPTHNGITTLFLDVGGVLLTNGWDRHARKRAADTFHLDHEEMDERHHLTFDTYETGKLSLDAYLDRVVFYEPRSFSRDEFKEFMSAQWEPYPRMMELIRALSRRDDLTIGVISNEGRELAVFRNRKFALAEFVDIFVYSSFVHFRKPDEDIYRLALDIAQSRPDQAVYVDDRALFAEVARGLGIHGIHHTDHESTCRALEELGVTAPAGVQ